MELTNKPNQPKGNLMTSKGIIKAFPYTYKADDLQFGSGDHGLQVLGES